MAQISDYYRNKTILITGVTGFIGKVLLEKLLRKCSGVSAIYCLVRDKNDEDAAYRLDSMLNHQCFDNLWREVSPLVRRKVRLVEGDVTKEDFGIRADMRAILEQSVDIVFHLAGTVKFDEPMRFSLELNVLAVRHLVQLCSGMKNLTSLVHMSTAYANCEQSFINEQVYPSLIDPAKVLDLLDWLDEDSFKLITSKLLDEKPNTYVFSKHLGEVLLMTEGCHLPISILRPSIVTASWLEPMPGWVDSDNGPSSLYVAMGKGLLRSMIADQYVVADIVPVDLVVNMMVVVAWFRATHLHDDTPQQPEHLNFNYPAINGDDDGGSGGGGEDLGGGGKDGGDKDDGGDVGGGDFVVKGGIKGGFTGDGEIKMNGDCVEANGFMDEPTTNNNNEDLARHLINNNHAINNNIVENNHNNIVMDNSNFHLDSNKHHNNNNSVYHLTTSGVNPFTWGEMEDSVQSYFKKNPLDCCFRRPKSHVITSNSFLHDCWILVSHLVPAYTADLGYILIGRKPRMVQTYQRLHRTMEVMEYLTTRSWQWTHNHMELVRGHMSPEDQKTFNFDPRILHWPTYIENFCYGTKKFLLKEDASGLPAARARLKMLRNLRYAFNTTIVVLAWRLLVANSQLARNSWYLLLSLVFKFVSFFRLTSSLQK